MSTTAFERPPCRHRPLTALARGDHPGFRFRAATVLSGDGRGLDEAPAPGAVSAVFTVEEGALDVFLRDRRWVDLLRAGVPVVVVPEGGRDAAELQARIETGAPVQ